jgi:hypothetical protein
MTYPTTYVSFLIRLWREATLHQSASPPELGGTEGGQEGAPDWQGEVEHIQTGERWTFSTLDELLGFLRRQVKESGVLNLPAGE